MADYLKKKLRISSSLNTILANVFKELKLAIGIMELIMILLPYKGNIRNSGLG